MDYWDKTIRRDNEYRLDSSASNVSRGLIQINHFAQVQVLPNLSTKSLYLELSSELFHSNVANMQISYKHSRPDGIFSQRSTNFPVEQFGKPFVKILMEMLQITPQFRIVHVITIYIYIYISKYVHGYIFGIHLLQFSLYLYVLFLGHLTEMWIDWHNTYVKSDLLPFTKCSWTVYMATRSNFDPRSGLLLHFT